MYSTEVKKTTIRAILNGLMYGTGAAPSITSASLRSGADGSPVVMPRKHVGNSVRDADLVGHVTNENVSRLLLEDIDGLDYSSSPFREREHIESVVADMLEGPISDALDAAAAGAVWHIGFALIEVSAPTPYWILGAFNVPRNYRDLAAIEANKIVAEPQPTLAELNEATADAADEFIDYVIHAITHERENNQIGWEILTELAKVARASGRVDDAIILEDLEESE